MARPSGKLTNDRTRVEEALISSMDEDAEVEQAWREEIERRLGELRDGSAATVPSEDVFRELLRTTESRTSR